MVIACILCPHGGSKRRTACNDKTAQAFHGCFYGLRNFCRKTAQFCATRRESDTAESPSVGNGAQACENVRNSLGLNYKSAALSQLSDQRISAINRLRLDTSSLQKME